MLRTHRHLGAYGLAVAEGQVLLIRKARGPYTGAWDLPGGGLEFGESPEEALHRELMEETGLQVLDHSLLDVYQNRLIYTCADGTEEDLQHIGIIYRITVGHSHPLRTEPDQQDSFCARWMALDSIADQPMTPFATRALGSLPV